MGKVSNEKAPEVSHRGRWTPAEAAMLVRWCERPDTDPREDIRGLVELLRGSRTREQILRRLYSTGARGNKKMKKKKKKGVVDPKPSQVVANFPERAESPIPTPTPIVMTSSAPTPTSPGSSVTIMGAVEHPRLKFITKEPASQTPSPSPLENKRDVEWLPHKQVKHAAHSHSTSGGNGPRTVTTTKIRRSRLRARPPSTPCPLELFSCHTFPEGVAGAQVGLQGVGSGPAGCRSLNPEVCFRGDSLLVSEAHSFVSKVPVVGLLIGRVYPPGMAVDPSWRESPHPFGPLSLESWGERATSSGGSSSASPTLFSLSPMGGPSTTTEPSSLDAQTDMFGGRTTTWRVEVMSAVPCRGSEPPETAERRNARYTLAVNRRNSSSAPPPTAPPGSVPSPTSPKVSPRTVAAIKEAEAEMSQRVVSRADLASVKEVLSTLNGLAGDVVVSESEFGESSSITSSSSNNSPSNPSPPLPPRLMVVGGYTSHPGYGPDPSVHDMKWIESLAVGMEGDLREGRARGEDEGVAGNPPGTLTHEINFQPFGTSSPPFYVDTTPGRTPSYLLPCVGLVLSPWNQAEASSAAVGGSATSILSGGSGVVVGGAAGGERERPRRGRTAGGETPQGPRDTARVFMMAPRSAIPPVRTTTTTLSLCTQTAGNTVNGTVSGASVKSVSRGSRGGIGEKRALLPPLHLCPIEPLLSRISLPPPSFFTSSVLEALLTVKIPAGGSGEVKPEPLGSVPFSKRTPVPTTHRPATHHPVPHEAGSVGREGGKDVGGLVHHRQHPEPLSPLVTPSVEMDSAVRGLIQASVGVVDAEAWVDLLEAAVHKTRHATRSRSSRRRSSASGTPSKSTGNLHGQAVAHPPAGNRHGGYGLNSPSVAPHPSRGIGGGMWSTGSGGVKNKLGQVLDSLALRVWAAPGWRLYNQESDSITPGPLAMISKMLVSSSSLHSHWVLQKQATEAAVIAAAAAKLRRRGSVGSKNKRNQFVVVSTPIRDTGIRTVAVRSRKRRGSTTSIPSARPQLTPSASSSSMTSKRNMRAIAHIATPRAFPRAGAMAEAVEDMVLGTGANIVGASLPFPSFPSSSNEPSSSLLGVGPQPSTWFASGKPRKPLRVRGAQDGLIFHGVRVVEATGELVADPLGEIEDRGGVGVDSSFFSAATAPTAQRPPPALPPHGGHERYSMPSMPLSTTMTSTGPVRDVKTRSGLFGNLSGATFNSAATPCPLPAAARLSALASPGPDSITMATNMDYGGKEAPAFGITSSASPSFGAPSSHHLHHAQNTLLMMEGAIPGDNSDLQRSSSTSDFDFIANGGGLLGFLEGRRPSSERLKRLSQKPQHQGHAETWVRSPPAWLATDDVPVAVGGLGTGGTTTVSVGTLPLPTSPLLMGISSPATPPPTTANVSPEANIGADDTTMASGVDIAPSSPIDSSFTWM